MLISVDEATPTVTITLSRDDALWWRNVIDEPHTWGNPGEAERVLSAVVAALAAPPPAPSENATPAFLGVQIVENAAMPAGMIISVAEDDIVVLHKGHLVRIAKTALRDALAAGRSAGEGTKKT